MGEGSGFNGNRGSAFSVYLQNVHPEVLKYCRAELLEENYFHAVLEATKGVAQRIRDLSGLGSDGAELVTAAFSGKAPILTLGSLKTESEKSEQRGFSNLLVGLFGAIRNPVAHSLTATQNPPPVATSKSPTKQT